MTPGLEEILLSLFYKEGTEILMTCLSLHWKEAEPGFELSPSSSKAESESSGSHSWSRFITLLVITTWYLLLPMGFIRRAS